MPRCPQLSQMSRLFRLIVYNCPPLGSMYRKRHNAAARTLHISQRLFPFISETNQEYYLQQGTIIKFDTGLMDPYLGWGVSPSSAGIYCTSLWDSIMLASPAQVLIQQTCIPQNWGQLTPEYTKLYFFSH